MFEIMIYIGGHQVEIKNGNVKINGKDTPLQNGKDHKHSVSGQEIFTVFKWGSTVNVYSFLRVWVATGMLEYLILISAGTNTISAAVSIYI